VCKDLVNGGKTAVTVNKAAHGFVVGDVIDVTGGNATCLAAGVAVASVPDANHFTYASSVSGGSQCSGTYTFAKKGTLCNTPAAGAPVTGTSATTFTVTVTGTGSCNGTYTAARRKANIRKSINNNVFYYTISPVEHCADLHLTDCVASTTPTTSGGKLYDKRHTCATAPRPRWPRRRLPSR
jgi:hypothetical protein